MPQQSGCRPLPTPIRHRDAIRSFRNLQRSVHFAAHTVTFIHSLVNTLELDLVGLGLDIIASNAALALNNYLNDERITDAQLDKVFENNPNLRYYVEKAGVAVNGYEGTLATFNTNINRLYNAGYRLSIFGGRLVGGQLNRGLEGITHCIGKVADAAEQQERRIEAAATNSQGHAHSQ